MAKWLGRDKLDCGCEVCATDAKYCASEIPRLGFMVEDGTGNTKHVRQADAPRTLLAIVGAVSQGSKGFGLTAPVAVPRLRRRPPVAPRAGTTALLCSAELTRPANNVRARDVVSSRASSSSCTRAESVLVQVNFRSNMTARRMAPAPYLAHKRRFR